MSNENDKAMTTIDDAAMMPIMEMSQAIERYKQFGEFVSHILKDGIDFGTIPGTSKKTLLKAGAEKLSTFFGLSKRFQIIERVEDWTGKVHDGEPFFYYLYRCSLYRNDLLVAESDGSCNSWEVKYRYRKQERKCPVCGLENIRKSKTGGWYCWVKTGGCGETFKVGNSLIETQEVGRKPNPDIADQVNTFQKMAQKRALVAAVLIAVNASDYFTQDIEDFSNVPLNDIVEGDFTEEPPKSKSPKSKSSKPKSKKSSPTQKAPNSPELLLKLLNTKTDNYFGSGKTGNFHLLNSIKKVAGKDWTWPKPDDIDGWRNAYVKALAYANRPKEDDGNDWAARDKQAFYTRVIVEIPFFNDGAVIDKAMEKLGIEYDVENEQFIFDELAKFAGPAADLRIARQDGEKG